MRAVTDKRLNIMICLITLALAHGVLSYTLPASFIVAEMVKYNHPSAPVYFQAATAKSGKLVVDSLVRKSDGRLFDVARDVPIFYWELIALMAANDAAKMSQFLASADVDMTKVSHGLFHYEPVFIIGADPSNDRLPQLWVEKQSFLPVRVIFKDKAITFEQWTSLLGMPKTKYPRIIRITVKDTVETITLVEKSAVLSGG